MALCIQSLAIANIIPDCFSIIVVLNFFYNLVSKTTLTLNQSDNLILRFFCLSHKPLPIHWICPKHFSFFTLYKSTYFWKHAFDMNKSPSILITHMFHRQAFAFQWIAKTFQRHHETVRY